MEDLQTFLRSVWRFIPAMIEAGFDILNPVQCSAPAWMRRN